MCADESEREYFALEIERRNKDEWSESLFTVKKCSIFKGPFTLAAFDATAAGCIAAER